MASENNSYHNKGKRTLLNCHCVLSNYAMHVRFLDDEKNENLFPYSYSEIIIIPNADIITLTIAINKLSSM